MTSTTYDQQVAAEVRAACARAQVSHRDLAKIIGLSPARTKVRLKGEYPFNVAEIAAIADELGISAAALYPQPFAMAA